MDNQFVAPKSAITLKVIAIGCIVLAFPLAWLALPGSMMLYVVAIILALASVGCSIAALCKKCIVFGVIMLPIGLLAGFVFACFGAFAFLGFPLPGPVMINEQIRDAGRTENMKKADKQDMTRWPVF